MRRFLGGFLSRDFKDDGNEKKKFKYSVFRVAEVRECEWLSDVFLRVSGFYEDFYYLVENVGFIFFVEDKCS